MESLRVSVCCDIISNMTMDESNELEANTLCKSCGLCCTGHLFIWAKLRPAELDPAEVLGLAVFRSDPRQRGFSHPCPLWDGQCTIHDSPHYPHVCRAYKCKLLKEVIHENIPLPEALAAIARAKETIRDVDALLPASSEKNFRKRFVAWLEAAKESSGRENIDPEFQRLVEALLDFYENVFGVSDLIDTPDEE